MNDLSKHRLVLPPEQEAIRAKCFHPTGTFVEFKKKRSSNRFRSGSRRSSGCIPKRLALKARDRSSTYEALNQAANRIAQAILMQRGQREESVGLLLGKGISFDRCNSRRAKGGQDSTFY